MREKTHTSFLFLIGVIFNEPFYSLFAIAFWSFISAGFYCVRTMKHLHMVDHKEHL